MWSSSPPPFIKMRRVLAFRLCRNPLPAILRNYTTTCLLPFSYLLVFIFYFVIVRRCKDNEFIIIDQIFHETFAHLPFILYLCNQHQEQSSSDGLTNRVLETTVVSTMWKNSINFKNIPNYAKSHLLHSLCIAICWYANPRVSNRFQLPSPEPRLVLHASLSWSGTHRRVPASEWRRDWYVS